MPWPLSTPDPTLLAGLRTPRPTLAPRHDVLTLDRRTLSWALRYWEQDASGRQHMRQTLLTDRQADALERLERNRAACGEPATWFRPAQHSAFTLRVQPGVLGALLSGLTLRPDAISLCVGVLCLDHPFREQALQDALTAHLQPETETKQKPAKNRQTNPAATTAHQGEDEMSKTSAVLKWLQREKIDYLNGTVSEERKGACARACGTTRGNVGYIVSNERKKLRATDQSAQNGRAGNGHQPEPSPAAAAILKASAAIQAEDAEAQAATVNDHLTLEPDGADIRSELKAARDEAERFENLADSRATGLSEIMEILGRDYQDWNKPAEVVQAVRDQRGTLIETIERLRGQLREGESRESAQKATIRRLTTEREEALEKAREEARELNSELAHLASQLSSADQRIADLIQERESETDLNQPTLTRLEDLLNSIAQAVGVEQGDQILPAIEQLRQSAREANHRANLYCGALVLIAAECGGNDQWTDSAEVVEMVKDLRARLDVATAAPPPPPLTSPGKVLFRHPRISLSPGQKQACLRASAGMGMTPTENLEERYAMFIATARILEGMAG